MGHLDHRVAPNADQVTEGAQKDGTSPQPAPQPPHKDQNTVAAPDAQPDVAATGKK